MNNYSLKKNVATNLIWKYLERVLAQFVSLIVSIILARLLSPNDYGAVALAMVFITLANVFVTSGFGSALIQKDYAESVDFSSVFYTSLLISIVIYFIIFSISPFVSSFYNLEVLTPVLRILGLRIIVASINSVQHAYVSRHMQFKLFFISTLFGTLLSCVVGVVLAYKGLGVWALVWQYLSNTIIDTIILSFTIDWHPTLEFSLNRTKQLFSFGWKLLVSELLNTFYGQLSNLLIGKYYTLSDLSFYSQGDKYPNTIVRNISVSINSVLFSAMSKYQNDLLQVKKMTRRSIQVSSFFMWPMMIGLAACSKPLVLILLTEKWLPVVPFIRIFCIVYGFNPIHAANLQAISAIGRSDIFLKLEIIKKAYGLVILLITIHFGPFIMALSLIPQCIISTFVNSRPNVKLLNYSYSEQMIDIVPAIVISLAMGFTVYRIEVIEFNLYTIVVIQVVFGIIIYIILSILFNRSTLQYVLNTLKERRENGK